MVEQHFWAGGPPHRRVDEGTVLAPYDCSRFSSSSAASGLSDRIGQQLRIWTGGGFGIIAASIVTFDIPPSLESIKELQTEYTYMLTSTFDPLKGAKYLWEVRPSWITISLSNLVRTNLQPISSWWRYFRYPFLWHLFAWFSKIYFIFCFSSAFKDI